VRQYTTAEGHTALLKDDSVDIEGTDPSAVDPIIDAAAPLYSRLGYELVITSAADGTHSEGSHHKDKNTPADGGWALDLRCSKAWGFSPEDQETIVEAMRAKLGHAYDVVLESTHLHIEKDI
jgi:hypothetical protein